MDVLIVDVTNGLTYPHDYHALLDTAEQMRREGNPTPQFAFITHSSTGPCRQRSLRPGLRQRTLQGPLVPLEGQAPDLRRSQRLRADHDAAPARGARILHLAGLLGQHERPARQRPGRVGVGRQRRPTALRLARRPRQARGGRRHGRRLGERRHRAQLPGRRPALGRQGPGAAAGRPGPRGGPRPGPVLLAAVAQRPQDRPAARLRHRLERVDGGTAVRPRRPHARTRHPAGPVLLRGQLQRGVQPRRHAHEGGLRRRLLHAARRRRPPVQGRPPRPPQPTASRR